MTDRPITWIVSLIISDNDRWTSYRRRYPIDVYRLREWEIRAIQEEINRQQQLHGKSI